MTRDAVKAGMASINEAIRTLMQIERTDLSWADYDKLNDIIKELFKLLFKLRNRVESEK